MDTPSSIGYIYNIYSVDINGNKISKNYIGSTTNKVEYRFLVHQNPKNSTGSKSLFINFALQSLKCDVLETFAFKDKVELRKREQFWIDYFGKDDCLNKNRAYLSPEERKKIALQIAKKHYQSRGSNNYIKVQCSCGKMISKLNINSHKKRPIHINAVGAK